MMRFRLSVAATLIGSATLAISASSNPTEASSRDAERDWIWPATVSTDAEVAGMQMTRAAFGLPNDERTVRALRDSVQTGEADVFEGAPVAAGELQLIKRQLADEDRAERAAETLRGFENFSGMWIDKSDGWSVSVAFVNEPSVAAEAVLDQLFDVPHKVLDRTVSRLELQESYELVAKTLVTAGIVVNTALSVSDAEIVVQGPTAELAVARERLDRFELTVPIRFSEGEVLAKEAPHYLAGGLRTASDASNAWKCTLGLPFVTAIGGHPRPTTAGHEGCTHSTHYRSVDAVALKITHLNWGPVDTSVLGPIGGSVLSDDIIIYSNFQISHYRDIIGRAFLIEGSTVCQSQGASIVTRCGPITNASAGTGGNLNFYRAQMCSMGGDSGSAAYKMVSGQRAFGVGNHTAGTPNGSACTATDIVDMVKVQEIEQMWELLLKTT